jgi:hypothetical protein
MSTDSNTTRAADQRATAAQHNTVATRRTAAAHQCIICTISHIAPSHTHFNIIPIFKLFVQQTFVF